MLTDVSTPSYGTTVLGADLAVPFMFGPVGVLGIAHPDGESAVARAAAAAGVPMVLSTAATTGSRTLHWRTAAGSAGTSCTGPRTRRWPPASSAGRRRPDTASLWSHSTPASWPGAHATWTTPTCRSSRASASRTTCTDPAFQAGLASPGGRRPRLGRAPYTQMFGDLSLTWDDIPFLRQHWNGPIVLKGVLSAADAVRAAERWRDGESIVSNHGGRQLDGAIAALDALPAVVHAVGARLTRPVRQRHPRRRRHAEGARPRCAGRPYRPRLRLRSGARRRGRGPARASVAPQRTSSSRCGSRVGQR